MKCRRKKRKQTEPIWQGETEISQRGETRGISDYADGRNFNGSFDRYSGTSGGFPEYRRAEDERSLENDHRNAGSGLSEIHRTEEELGYDTNKNGYGTDHLGIDEYRKENIQKIEQNHVENEEKEVERTSFSFAQM
nr:hypothetical protein [Streptococcus equi]